MGGRGRSISEAVRLADRAETRGLRRRAVLAISALVALVLGAQATVLAYFGNRHFREETEKRARAYAVLAAEPACAAYESYFESGYSKFRELMLELSALNPDLERFEIYDVESRRLFDSSRLSDETLGMPSTSQEASTPVDERLRDAIRGLETRFWRPESAGSGWGAGGFVVVAPRVEEWGRHRYSVVFRFSYAGLVEARRDIAWQLGGLALLALALGVIFAYLLSAQSLVPVAALTRGARRMAEGDLEHRIQLETGDEFEMLGATLDLMAARLASTIDDLEGSNQRLNHLIEELREIDRVKSDLLANVSHELRTPLTAIGGYVEAMAAGLLGDLDDAQKRSLEVVERNVERLRDMIDQLLNYSRMQSERRGAELVPFDVGAVARQVAESVAAARLSRAGEPVANEPELRVDCAPDLPEVYGDAGGIGQVIENLLTNAIKFSPEGGRIDLTVRPVATGETGEGVEVAVADQGIGIPEELQGKIFDRFYQVDGSSKRSFGGIGLGLALVREILELHHGRIEVESAAGRGSTFRFVLPLATERSGLVATPAARRAGDQPRVVLVDDDGAYVREMAAYLSSRGFLVDAAATAAQGETMIRRLRPDAVVLDRLLPDEDGFDLLTRLLRAEPTRSIPVVLATVRREKALALQRGAAAYLRKPFEPAVLEAALRELLDESGRAPDDPDPETSSTAEARQGTEVVDSLGT